MLAEEIIKRPVITEKTNSDMQEVKYTFEVAKNPNKIQIAKAVEYIFGLKVIKVNTIMMNNSVYRELPEESITQLSLLILSEHSLLANFYLSHCSLFTAYGTIL